MLNGIVIPLHELVFEVTQEAEGGFVAESPSLDATRAIHEFMTN
jgi:hypothetical protein